jgi:hypothetical protein
LNATAIRKIEAAGYRLRLAGDALQVSPADRLTADQRAFIRAHKADLVAALEQPAGAENLLKPTVQAAQGHGIDAATDLEEWFEERAAILEYDAGFSRDEAERRALALMSAENLLKPTVQAPPVESAVAPPLPVAKPEIVCCGDCAHSILPPDTCPVYGWRLCGLSLEGGGGFGRTERRCQAWAAN